MTCVWTPELVTTLQGHYEAGLTYDKIAAAMGLTRHSIASQLVRHGFCGRSNEGWWTEERKEHVRRRYLDHGLSYSQIAKELGTTRSAVGSTIKRMGILRDATGPRKTSARDDLTRRAKIRQLASRHYVDRPFVMRAEQRSPRPTAVVPEPKRLSFDEMRFGKFCAYPVGDEGNPISYCGHDTGLTFEGKNSSYCPGHHRVTHKPEARR